MERFIVCLIHLGDEETPHLWANLSYLEKSFRDIEFTLISDSVKFIDKATKLGIKTYYYTRDDSIDEMFDRIERNFDFEFRKGFWRFSLERLFAFTQFHSTISGPLLHIESDILLLRSFPWSQIFSLEKMGWQSLGTNSDVASIILSPTPLHSDSFRKRMMHQLEEDQSLTDMTLLARMRQAFPSEYVTIPSAPSGEMKIFNKYPLEEVIRISSLTKDFDGYFDSAPIGMWNFGQDPRNNYGFSVRFKKMPESILDPSKIQIRLEGSDLRLIDQYGNTIYALHVHSKNLSLFGPKNIDVIRQLISPKIRQRKYIFHRDMFVRLISDYKRRGKLLELFGNLPMFNFLDRFWFFRKFKLILKKLTRLNSK